MLSAGDDLTPAGRVREASIAQVCDWTQRSWKGVEKEVVVKSFKKCSISSAVDGTEDDEIYQHEESDSIEVTGNVEILTVSMSLWPSMMYKCKFVFGT